MIDGKVLWLFPVNVAELDENPTNATLATLGNFYLVSSFYIRKTVGDSVPILLVKGGYVL